MKKNRQTFLVFIHLLFLAIHFTGCIREDDIVPPEECKEDCVVFTGYLLSNNPSISVGDIKMDVFWDDSGPIGTYIKGKATTKTDNDGYYFLKFPLRDDELHSGFFRVVIYASSDVFHCWPDEPHGFNFYWLERDSTYTTNYGLCGKAKLILKSEGVEQMSDGDSFFSKVTSHSGVNYLDECGPLIQWKQENQNKVHEIEVAANTQVLIEKNIKKDGIRKIKVDTLFLSLNETREIIASFN